jgi:UDP-2-acetamido-3-amino-2,3-dideoxy-glucuronate N-acetyltransferase
MKSSETSIKAGRSQTHVKGVTLHQMPKVFDGRGNLTVGEMGREVPFDVRRYFMVYEVPSEQTRGEHAHRQCHQFLICVRGQCSVVADDGRAKQEFLLNRPDLGLYLPPMTWGVQYNYSADGVLLVLASDPYEANDYIRDYDEYLLAVGATS